MLRYDWDNATPHEQEIAHLQNLVRATYAFLRFWNEALSDVERERLGGDVNAFADSRTPGVLMRLRGWSEERAVVEGASMMNFIDSLRRTHLLRQLEETGSDLEGATRQALEEFDLVLVECTDERIAYWRGQEIDIDWFTNQAAWIFFSTVCRKTKQGSYADVCDFGDRFRSRNFISSRQNRLISLDGFPDDLGILFSTSDGRSTIDLPQDRICILEAATVQVVQRV